MFDIIALVSDIAETLKVSQLLVAQAISKYILRGKQFSNDELSESEAKNLKKATIEFLNRKNCPLVIKLRFIVAIDEVYVKSTNCIKNIRRLNESSDKQSLKSKILSRYQIEESDSFNLIWKQFQVNFDSYCDSNPTAKATNKAHYIRAYFEQLKNSKNRHEQYLTAKTLLKVTEVQQTLLDIKKRYMKNKKLISLKVGQSLFDLGNSIIKYCQHFQAETKALNNELQEKVKLINQEQNFKVFLQDYQKLESYGALLTDVDIIDEKLNNICTYDKILVKACENFSQCVPNVQVLHLSESKEEQPALSFLNVESKSWLMSMATESKQESKVMKSSQESMEKPVVTTEIQLKQIHLSESRDTETNPLQEFDICKTNSILNEFINLKSSICTSTDVIQEATVLKPLNEYHENKKSLNDSIKKDVKAPSKGVNTPCHFRESRIIKHYSWLDVEVKREFYRVANLVYKQCRTKNIQTDERKSKQSTSTQIYLPQKTETQTPIPAMIGHKQKRQHLEVIGDNFKMHSFETM